MTKEAALQLAKHFEKTEFQLQHPRITDTVLTTNAKSVLSQLELERKAASDEQGCPERVQDWWAAPTKIGKKKKRKGNMTGKKQGARAGQNVNVEELGDDVGVLRLGEEEEMGEQREEGMEEEEGRVLLEEKFAGFESPILISPAGPVVGDRKEEEGEGEEE